MFIYILEIELVQIKVVETFFLYKTLLTKIAFGYAKVCLCFSLLSFVQRERSCQKCLNGQTFPFVRRGMTIVCFTNI